MNPCTNSLLKLISGGQTGADRGALEAALACDFPYGGTCPRGRLAEDGVIPEMFQLIELPSKNYAKRTEQNVINSDATLILSFRALSGGSSLTERLAAKHKRPFLHLMLAPDGSGAEAQAKRALFWIDSLQVATLNVAGPRESKEPGLQKQSRLLIQKLLTLVDKRQPAP